MRPRAISDSGSDSEWMSDEEQEIMIRDPMQSAGVPAVLVRAVVDDHRQRNAIDEFFLYRVCGSHITGHTRPNIELQWRVSPYGSRFRSSAFDVITGLDADVVLGGIEMEHIEEAHRLASKWFVLPGFIHETKADKAAQKVRDDAAASTDQSTSQNVMNTLSRVYGTPNPNTGTGTTGTSNVAATGNASAAAAAAATAAANATSTTTSTGTSNTP